LHGLGNLVEADTFLGARAGDLEGEDHAYDAAPLPASANAVEATSSACGPDAGSNVCSSTRGIF
jgi:hypothetical protein